MLSMPHFRVTYAMEYRHFRDARTPPERREPARQGDSATLARVYAAAQFVTLVVVAQMCRPALGLAPVVHDAAARVRVRRGNELFIAGCRSQAWGVGRSC